MNANAAIKSRGRQGVAYGFSLSNGLGMYWSSFLERLVGVCVCVSGVGAGVVSARELRVENSASRSSSVEAVVVAARERVDFKDLAKARRSCLSVPESFLGGFVRRTLTRERRSRICFLMVLAGSESEIAKDSASRSSVSSISSSSTMSSSTAASSASSVDDAGSVACCEEVVDVIPRLVTSHGAKPKVVGSYSRSGSFLFGAPVPIMTFSGVT